VFFFFSVRSRLYFSHRKNNFGQEICRALFGAVRCYFVLCLSFCILLCEVLRESEGSGRQMLEEAGTVKQGRANIYQYCSRVYRKKRVVAVRLCVGCEKIYAKICDICEKREENMYT
jgi:hypothetical protein